jgi:hypothetical protein
MEIEWGKNGIIGAAIVVATALSTVVAPVAIKKLRKHDDTIFVDYSPATKFTVSKTEFFGEKLLVANNSPYANFEFRFFIKMAGEKGYQHKHIDKGDVGATFYADYEENNQGDYTLKVVYLNHKGKQIVQTFFLKQK